MNRELAVVLCDNTSALLVVKSEKATARTRHLRARHEFIRGMISGNELILSHVPTIRQRADLLTKNVTGSKFITNRDALMSRLGADGGYETSI